MIIAQKFATLAEWKTTKHSSGHLWSKPLPAFFWRRIACIPVTLFILALSIDLASAATLVNGAEQTGSINTTNTTDSYTFSANTGDSINVRLGTTNFYGLLQLYAPGGALVGTATDSTDDLIAYEATNSGTFTVHVSSSGDGDLYTGTYAVRLAQIPEAFIVPANETPNRSKLRGICPATGTTSVVDTSPFLLGCLVAECSA